MSTLTRKIVSKTSAAKVESKPYNHATIVDRTVYLSGCLGMDAQTLELVPGGAGPEMAKALQNLQAVLGASNSSVDNVVKTSVYLVDLKDHASIDEEYKKVFKNDYPARTLIQIAKLPLDARVEIDAIALTGDVKTDYV